MSILKLFMSPEAKKVAILHDTLKLRHKARKVGAPLPPTLLDVMDSNVEAATIKTLLDKPKLDFYVREDATFLDKLVKAKDSLAQGDVDPAIAIYTDGNDNQYFQHLTGGKPNKHKMNAKQKLFKQLYKPVGDHGDPSFNYIKDFVLAQQREAINGYAEMGMQYEATEAMQTYVELDKFDQNATQYVRTYMNEFTDNKDGNLSTLGLAAMDAAEGLNLMATKDYLSVINKHPDDAKRISAMVSITKQLDSYDRFTPDNTALFSTLVDHMDSDKNKNTLKSSQAKAAKLLGENATLLRTRDRFESEKIREVEALRDVIGDDINMIDVKEHIKPNLADKYYDTVIGEVRKGNHAILGAVFGNENDTVKFITDYSIYKQRSENAKDVDLAGVVNRILPADLEGVAAARSRNHFAAQFTSLTTATYSKQEGNAQPYEGARIAANLAGAVMMDTTLPANSLDKYQAMDSLFRLRNAEEHATKEKAKVTIEHHDENKNDVTFNASSSMRSFLLEAGYISKQPISIHGSVMGIKPKAYTV